MASPGRRAQWPIVARAMIAVAVAAIGPSSLAAADQSLQDFQRWFAAYRTGKVESTGSSSVEVVFHGAERCPGELSALLLLDVATFRFSNDTATEKHRFAALQPWSIRERAVLALSRLEDAAARGYLRRTMLLDHVSAAVNERRVAAARAVAMNPLPADLYYLQRGLLDKEADVRLACVLGLGTAGSKSTLVPLEPMVADQDEGVRVAALTSVGKLCSLLAPIDPEFVREAALEHVRGALADSSWRVRLVAAEVLRQIRAAGNVPALIDALANETVTNPQARERVRSAIHRALLNLTAAPIAANRPDDWRAWWEKTKDRFQLAAEPKTQSFQSPKYPHLFDIPLNSDRILFVLDISGSMRETLAGGETVETPDPRRPSKYDRLLTEMAGALDGMGSNVEFDIILFNDRTHRLWKELRRVTPESRAQAMAWLRSITPNGGTNLFGGLETALGIGAISGIGRYYGYGADTIVLLSDGQPTVGTVVEPSRIADLISDANRLSRVQIHTISLGNSPLLRELARRNEGEHRAIP